MFRNIHTLDGWRAVAISCVLFSHGYPSIQRGAGLPDLSFREPLGVLGVEIFFALSGYLITTKLLQEEDRDGSISLSQFYVRRFFRIMPAAVILIAFAAILSTTGAIPAISTSRLLSAALFAANYSDAPASYYLAHFWSLAVEEHFYFVWPTILVLCATRRKRITATVTLACLSALWRAMLWKFQITTEDPAKFYGRTDIMVDAILWGSALALIASAGSGGFLRITANRTVWLSLVAVSIFAALSKSSDWKANMALFTITKVTIPLIIFGTIIDSKSACGNLLDSAPLRFVGRISYSLYLWQQVFLIIPATEISQGRFNNLQYFPINFCFTILCAIASYYLVEQPAIYLGRYLAAQRNVATSLRS